MTYEDFKNKIILSDALEGLKTLPDNSIDCCVTSPPYFGLRDYGVVGQLGLEASPEIYIEKMVEVFSEVKRVLKKDGTLWLNIGDSYAGSGKGGQSKEKRSENWQPLYGKYFRSDKIKPKDLIGIPFILVLALRDYGWYWRDTIIWHKPNPMPESVNDRCTKSHEYIFLLSRSGKYYYDLESILKDASVNTHSRLSQDIEKQIGSTRANGGERHNGNMKATGRKLSKPGVGIKNNTSFDSYMAIMPLKVNKRSVWTIPTQSYSDAHFATFPEELIVDCIKAGCREDGIVLDPFMGAGTTALVARKLNRNFIGIELNPDYIKIAEKRLRKELGLFI